MKIRDKRTLNNNRITVLVLSTLQIDRL